jgi:hypothetical protein
VEGGYGADGGPHRPHPGLAVEKTRGRTSAANEWAGTVAGCRPALSPPRLQHTVAGAAVRRPRLGLPSGRITMLESWATGAEL